ncbi:hypothetical protein BO94DRAFT_578275 [Aspergillus sclerotioniger CBS 115572]|uniref:Methyltransferase domain-containing protein n=1 Tax=Aspergillus sclerotioniger CBS 115572 TaxID=1450535 RepID=A0A317VLT2_9EURO|nr:hypothetical protein BO94DRAFT_578275 [Aspergillus sclerotioniger CBS 115572]PWY73898.1 hypothetical protein BO94DRAFT_578275 [Aspergillus sclerotioniger CBS 115572]
MAKNTIDIYPLNRDEEESKRLNQQHRMFLNLIKNNIIDPAISKDSLRAVADIGTGTGIWLEDVGKLFTKDSIPYLHGFDISDDQFPESSEILELSVHDVLNEFPPEHINRYDLVHVRFFVTCIREDQYTQVVRNMASLIIGSFAEPGGYLQWEEGDHSKSFRAIEKEAPRLQDAVNSFRGYFVSGGFSLYAPDNIEQACNTAGLNLINKSWYSTTTASAEQVEEIRFQFLCIFQQILRISCRDRGSFDTESNAQVAVEQQIDLMKASFDKGLVPDAIFCCILYQKP